VVKRYNSQNRVRAVWMDGWMDGLLIVFINHHHHRGKTLKFTKKKKKKKKNHKVEFGRGEEGRGGGIGGYFKTKA